MSKSTEPTIKFETLPSVVQESLASLLGGRVQAESLMKLVLSQKDTGADHAYFLQHQSQEVLPRWVKTFENRKIHNTHQRMKISPIAYLMGPDIAQAWEGTHELSWGPFNCVPVERIIPAFGSNEISQNKDGFLNLLWDYVSADGPHDGPLLSLCSSMLYTDGQSAPSTYKQRSGLSGFYSETEEAKPFSLSDTWVLHTWFPKGPEEKVVNALEALIVMPQSILIAFKELKMTRAYERYEGMQEKFPLLAEYCAPALCTNSSMLADFLTINSRVGESMGNYGNQVYDRVLCSMIELIGKSDQIALHADAALKKLPTNLGMAMRRELDAGRTMIEPERFNQIYGPLKAAVEASKIRSSMSQVSTANAENKASAKMRL